MAGFAEDQLLVAIPFHRMIGILHALDHGVGGERKKERESVERQIDQLGKVETLLGDDTCRETLKQTDIHALYAYVKALNLA